MKASIMHAEMAEQSAVLAQLVRAADATIESVKAVIPKHLTGITWVARGSSDNAAVLGRYLSELSSGRPAGLAAPSLITRYGAQLDYRGQLVVGLSQSGETPEVVTVCESLRQAGATVIAVTNVKDSRLAAAADAALLTEAGAELAVPATKTVTAQMLLVSLIAAALGSLPLTADDLRRLPDAIDDQLRREQEAEDLAARWFTYEGLVVVARGLTYASALETALKVREVAAVQAEALSVPDLLHGPIAASRADLPVLLLGGGSSTEADLNEVSDRLQRLDVPQHRFDAGLDLPEVLTPIAATVAGQQLALAWASARGLDPDQPAGLSKVTLTD